MSIKAKMDPMWRHSFEAMTEDQLAAYIVCMGYEDLVEAAKVILDEKQSS